MTNLTNEVLNYYQWDNEEIKVLETIGVEGIQAKFRKLTEKQFEAICKYFDGWILRETPKARLNYWMNQTGLTVAEINIWMTV